MNIRLISFLNFPLNFQLDTRNWRNQKNVSKFFKIKNISENIHRKWLNSLAKEHPESIAFVISYNKVYIGVTYFHSINYESKVADWGIYISNESYRGMGIGKKVLLQCIEYASDVLLLEKFFLDVLETNLAGKKIYEECGFKKISENKSFLRYVLKLNYKYEKSIS